MEGNFVMRFVVGDRTTIPGDVLAAMCIGPGSRQLEAGRGADEFVGSCHCSGATVRPEYFGRGLLTTMIGALHGYVVTAGGAIRGRDAWGADSANA